MTLIIITMAILPCFYTYRKSLRMRRLAESRRDISLAVSQMEKFLLSGEIESGQVSHDLLFKHMQRVQYSDVYEVNWSVLKNPSKKVIQLSKKLSEELNSDDCKFTDTFRFFLTAYFKAYRYKHPYVSLIYVTYLQLLRGGIKCAITALVTILFLSKLKFSKRITKLNSYESGYSEEFFTQSEAVWCKREFA